MDDEMQRRTVAPGQVPGLMAAYRRAVRGADQLRAGLIAVGLDPAELTVVAGLSEDGESAVHVTTFPVLAVTLAALLADDTGRPDFGARGGPNVA
jgi:hypothetical protein